MAKKVELKKEKIATQLILEPEFQLIRWDIYSKSFIGICGFVFFIMLIFDLSFSSIGMWNQVTGDNQKGVLLGKPRFIRSDEWLVMKTQVMSQVNNNYADENSALGAGKPGMIQQIPVRNFYSIFKVDMWGFHLFNAEKGVSFFWAFKSAYFLAILFLTFMLLSKNNFWISTFGSLWLFMSSEIQWWGYWSDKFTYACSIFVFFILLAYSKKILPIIIYSILLIIFIPGLVFTFYPPHQVPSGHILLVFIAAYLVAFFKKDLLFKLLPIKIISISIIGFVSITVLYFYFQEIKSTIELITNTVYPGKRDLTGGGLDKTKLFSEFLFVFIDETKFPLKWGNICEASHFLIFFPIIFYRIIQNFILRKQNNIVLLFISGYILFCLIFMLIGLPKFLSHLTLMFVVPEFRLTMFFGMANVFAVVIFLSSSEYETKNTTIENLIFLILCVVFFSFYFIWSNNELDKFFTSNQIFIGILLASITYFTLFNSLTPIYLRIFFVLILGYSAINMRANPLMQGLKPLTNNYINRFVSTIVKEDRNSKWVVYGSQFTIANLIKSTGANVINGVKYPPDFSITNILDENKKYDSIYNRYAHISYYPSESPKAEFKLIQTDSYAVIIDPCSPKLDSLNVKYFLFTYQPQPFETRCMSQIFSQGIYIYKKN